MSFANTVVSVLRSPPMFWVGVLLIVLWLLGVATAHTLGGFIHILLVAATNRPLAQNYPRCVTALPQTTRRLYNRNAGVVAFPADGAYLINRTSGLGGLFALSCLKNPSTIKEAKPSLYPLLDAVGHVDGRKDAVVVVRIAGTVIRDAGRTDQSDAGSIGWHELLPGLAAPSTDIDCIHLRRQFVWTVDVNERAVFAPAYGNFSGFNTAEWAPLSAGDIVYPGPALIDS